LWEQGALVQTKRARHHCHELCSEEAYKAAGGITNVTSAWNESRNNLIALAVSGALMSPSDTQKLAAFRIAQKAIPSHISDTKKAELPPPPPTQMPALDSYQCTSCVLIERVGVYLCVLVNQDDPFEWLFY